MNRNPLRLPWLDLAALLLLGALAYGIAWSSNPANAAHRARILTILKNTL